MGLEQMRQAQIEELLAEARPRTRSRPKSRVASPRTPRLSLSKFNRSSSAPTTPRLRGAPVTALAHHVQCAAQAPACTSADTGSDAGADSASASEALVARLRALRVANRVHSSAQASAPHPLTQA